MWVRMHNIYICTNTETHIYIYITYIHIQVCVCVCATRNLAVDCKPNTGRSSKNPQLEASVQLRRPRFQGYYRGLNNYQYYSEGSLL